MTDKRLRKDFKRALGRDAKRAKIGDAQHEERDAAIRAQWARRRLLDGDCLAPQGDSLSGN